MISPAAFTTAPATANEATEFAPLARVSTGSLKFARFGWCVLAYCIATVVWGSFVRASGAGDGCGAHWPKCDGSFIPLFSGNWEKSIEASHRLTSGLILPLVIALLVGAHRVFPRRDYKSHPARKAAAWALAATMLEVIIGAVLVKMGWVDKSTATGRVFLGIAHLMSTFLLVGSIALTAWWGGGAARLNLRGQGPLATALLGAVAGTILLGITGAISALGDTIYPASSLLEGLKQDFNPTSHYLLQLRVWHPWLASTMSLYVILIAGVVTKLRPSADVIRCARLLSLAFLLQMAAGFVNLLYLAPVPLQMLHLFLADLLWLAMLLMAVSALAAGVPQIETAQDDSLAGLLSGKTLMEGVGRATWKDYVVLTKPRVISLLLLTTVAAMFVASGNQLPSFVLVLATSVGFYMAAGAANTINMVLERDLDLKMKRTAQRPLVTQKISSRHALRFAFLMAFGSFVTLSVFASTLSALMALSGLVFYVVVYTIMLKRRSWHNIVIGGAAGAFPPLVGWAAVTGSLNNVALVLFALIFVWTPVHFWALALLIKEDYAEAGVPMLPCVRGDRATVVQIAAYTVLTVAVSLVPLFLRGADGLPFAGPVYLCAALLLNAVLVAQSTRLFRVPERAQASSLFHYSMIYLAVLFVSLAVERAGWQAALAAIFAGWVCFELEKLSRPLGKTAAG